MLTLLSSRPQTTETSNRSAIVGPQHQRNTHVALTSPLSEIKVEHPNILKAVLLVQPMSSCRSLQVGWELELLRLLNTPLNQSRTRTSALELGVGVQEFEDCNSLAALPDIETTHKRRPSRPSSPLAWH
jgi:hypothetical protein